MMRAALLRGWVAHTLLVIGQREHQLRRPDAFSLFAALDILGAYAAPTSSA
jgi:hypothetical protein